MFTRPVSECQSLLLPVERRAPRTVAHPVKDPRACIFSSAAVVQEQAQTTHKQMELYTKWKFICEMNLRICGS